MTLDRQTRVVGVAGVTEGQACSAKLGIEGLDPARPVLFAPCDAGYVYDPEAWRAVEETGDADLVVWAARRHLPAAWRPHMYGWLHARADAAIDAVAVKKQIDGLAPEAQSVVVGTFWFKDVRTFVREVDELVADDERVNGEFYIDTIARRMVEGKKSVRAFVVDKFIPWGTPEELKTFLYWNAVFRGGRRL